MSETQNQIQQIPESNVTQQAKIHSKVWELVSKGTQNPIVFSGLLTTSTIIMLLKDTGIDGGEGGIPAEWL
jgi:hypothetical protein